MLYIRLSVLMFLVGFAGVASAVDVDLSMTTTTGYDDMRTVATDIRQLAAELGLERPYLVGADWGGLVARRSSGRGRVCACVVEGVFTFYIGVPCI